MSTDIIAVKQLKDRLPKLVDSALDVHARAADNWAGKVRLIFAIVSAAAALWFWNSGSNAKFIYLALAIIWLVVTIAVNLRSKNGVSDSIVTATTMIDLTVVHLGLLAFVQQGLFPNIGSGLFLCYFTILAVASTRYRIGLVITAGIYAMVVYGVISFYAGVAPWFSLSMLAATILVFVMGSRKPKNLMVEIAGDALQQAFELGAKRKELDLTAEVHQLFMPPRIVDLPMIWSASKHGAGAETSGDYFHIFEADRSPIVVIGDLPGRGFEAIDQIAQLHMELEKIIARESNLMKISEELNAYIWNKYQGRKQFTCVIARWEGEQMHYINAGHLPAIQFSKQEHKQLPVTSQALGTRQQAEFKEEAVPFPARDLLILYTDGSYGKLTDDRKQGANEIETLAEKFHVGEVNTLCHRIFDCAQPGIEQNSDDSTVVVIRRQPATASASA